MVFGICPLSKKVPEEPVVSPVSGCIFEKRMIIKHIQENGTDPINGKQLTEDMLVEVKPSPEQKPSPSSASSIPALIKNLQDELAAMMQRSSTLNYELNSVQQELSQMTYQRNVALRVIGRLMKKISDAQDALATLTLQAEMNELSGIQLPQHAEGAAAQPSEEAGMTQEVIQMLEDKATRLMTERKKKGKSVPKELSKPEEIRRYKTLGTYTSLHSASIPGILAMDICPSNTSRILTGGNDKNATIFNKDIEQVVTSLKGHTKKVTSVIYHPQEDTVITASHDFSIRVWHVPSSQTVQVVQAHAGPVTALSLHATGDYLLSTSTDELWAFSDLRTGRVLTKSGDTSKTHTLTTAQFHPDGMLFATGTSHSLIKIWDLRGECNVANFSGHSGAISAISFSENGYHLATSAGDSVVKLWDLKKLKNFETINLQKGYGVKDLCFDHSGKYLAIAGKDVRLYTGDKQWQPLRAFQDHTALVTAVRFSHYARCIVSSSMDRTLKIYGP